MTLTPAQPATWYNTPERIAALVARAQSWEHTPWRANSAFPGKGGGVSCHNLQAELHRGGPLPQDFVTPRGSVRETLNGPATAILDWCDAHLGDVFKKAEGPAVVGDLVFFRAEEKSAQLLHFGTVVPGLEPHHTLRVVHVLLFRGVMFSEMADPAYGNLLAAIRRPAP
jgi:hypothetical protein